MLDNLAGERPREYLTPPPPASWCSSQRSERSPLRVVRSAPGAAPPKALDHPEGARPNESHGYGRHGDGLFTGCLALGLTSTRGYSSGVVSCVCCRLSFCSRVHGHVLQRAVRQVRHAAAVRLLPVLGPQLGVPQEGHHGGDHQL